MISIQRDLQASNFTENINKFSKPLGRITIREDGVGRYKLPAEVMRVEEEV